MSTYQGILVRNNLQDVGTIPRSGAYTGCPDIIPYGQVIVNDPVATFCSPDAYAKDFGGQITAGNVNYVYVRGKNLNSTADTGQAWLFYAPSSVVCNPTTWLNNHIPQVAPGSSPPPVSIPAQPNSVGVVAQPFVWLNPVLPDSGQHYCLVAMVASAGETIQQIVAAANQIVDGASLGAWILNNPGVGWRNVVTTPSGSADISTITSYTLPYSAPSTMHFTLNCKNMPAGSQVSFQFTTPTRDQAITLPPTTIPIPQGGKAGDLVPSINIGVTAKVPANYQSQVYYQWYSNGFTKGAGWMLTIEASVVSNGKDALKAFAGMPEHSFAAMVGEDTHHYHPKVGVIKGLGAFSNKLSAALGDNPAGSGNDPFSPPPVPTDVAVTVGSHSTRVA
jgi:hypothetical protein